MDDNDISTPYALFKAAMGYMKLGDNKTAVEFFNRVKKEYPASTEARQVEKYIGYAEQSAGL